MFLWPQYSVITDGAGNVLVGASVKVTTLNGATPTIYSTADGGVSIPDSIIHIGNTGECRFYAPAGRYVMTITSLDNTSTISDIRLGDYRTESTIFYSDSLDATDQLTTFLNGLKSRVSDNFGGDPLYTGILEVDFLGRKYTISDMISLDESLSGVVLKNYSFFAGNSTNWSDSAKPSMFKVVGGLSPARSIAFKSGRIHTARRTSIISVENTDNFSMSENVVSGFKDFGVKSFNVNSNFLLSNVKGMEYDLSSTAANPYPNRTGSTFWVEKTDGSIINCRSYLSKVGLKTNLTRSLVVANSVFSIGALSNEADRFNAPCVDLGSTDATYENMSGITFNSNRFDGGIVKMTDSFYNQFVASTWTQGGAGISPVVLVSSVANATASGLSFIDYRISTAHSSSFIDFQVSGSGSWASTTLEQRIGGKIGADQVIPDRGTPSINIIPPTQTSGINTSLPKMQISEAVQTFGVGGVKAEFSVNSKYGSPSYSLSQWGPASALGPGLRAGVSLSNTVGAFGSYPTAGTPFLTLMGTGDTGSGFSTGNYGGAIRYVAESNWNATTHNTKIQLGTTSGTTFAWKLEVDSSGNLVPAVDKGTSLGSPTKKFKNTHTCNLLFYNDVAPLTPAAGAVALFFDGELKSLDSAGQVKVVGSGATGKASVIPRDFTIEAFTDAIEEIRLAGGGELFLLPGTYHVKDTEVHPSVNITGSGRAASVILVDPGASEAGLRIMARRQGVTTQGAFYPEFKNFSIDGNEPLQTNIVNGFMFENAMDDPNYGGDGKPYSAGKMSSIQVYNCSGIGVKVEPGRGRFYCDNLQIVDCDQIGLFVGGNDSVVGERCGFGSCDQHAFKVSSCSNPIIIGVNVWGKPTKRSDDCLALLLQNVNGGSVTSCTINDTLVIIGKSNEDRSVTVAANMFKPHDSYFVSDGVPRGTASDKRNCFIAVQGHDNVLITGNCFNRAADDNSFKYMLVVYDNAHVIFDGATTRDPASGKLPWSSGLPVPWFVDGSSTVAARYTDATANITRSNGAIHFNMQDGIVTDETLGFYVGDAKGLGLVDVSLAFGAPIRKTTKSEEWRSMSDGVYQYSASSKRMSMHFTGSAPSYVITLPPDPLDREEREMVFHGPVTSLQIISGSSAVLNSTNTWPSSITASPTRIVLKYRQTANTWYRIQ